jgi:uncharacterized membrane protein YfhO
LTHFSNTKIKGNIDCTRDGLLYTSIPQNANNWSVKVDGKNADIVLIGNCMIGVYLPEGQHTVTFVYENPAFSLGWKISLACAAVLLALYVAVYKPQMPKHTKGKFEK